MGVGSGLKCGVNLWVACRDIWEMHNSWKHVAEEREVRIRSGSHWRFWKGLMKIVFLTLLLLAFFAFLSKTENKLVTSILPIGLTETSEL